MFRCKVLILYKLLIEGEKKLGDEYESKFDKVLLDTPCSGEGRFIATSPPNI